MAFAEEIDEVYIGESVISASGYEQDIRNAPASISVIDKEEIMSRPLRDLGDAVQDVPGVYVEANKTGGNKISMRGFSSTYTLILIDGKRQNVAQGFDASGFADGTYSSFMPPPSMIERIEVIRGPASTIYGSDAMGGVINIITKKHPKKLTGGFQVEMKLSDDSATFGNIYGVNAYMASPIDDIQSFNLRGGYKYGAQNSFYKPGYGKNSAITCSSATCTNPFLGWSASGFQNWNLGGRLNYALDSHNNLYVDLDAKFTRAGSLNTSSNSVTVVRDFYKTNSIINYDADYSWGKINSYVQYAHTLYAAHYDNSLRSAGGHGLKPGAQKGDGIAWGSATHNQDIIFQTTFNNNYDLGDYGVIIFNGGIYYMYEHLYTLKESNNHMNQFSIFGEGEYLINEYVSTTLGLRINVSDKFNSIAMPNPRFYVNYNPAQWVTIKAGISSGVLVPRLSYLYDGYTLATSNGTTTATYGNKDLKPETSWNYELSAIFDTRDINVTLTGFYTDFNNQVSSVSGINQGQSLDGQVCDASGATQCTFYRNLSKSLMAGAEFGFRLKPIYGFSLDSSYGFTYTKALKTTSANSYLKNEPVNSIPMHKFSIKPSYSYEGFSAYLRFSGYFKTPTAPINPNNSRNQPNTQDRYLIGKYYKDYMLLDLGISYKFPQNYSLTFAVNNLTNVNFIDLVQYTSNSNGQSTTTNWTNHYQRILPSRSYWLTFKAEF